MVGELLAVNPRLAIAIVSDANASDLRRRFAKANRIDFLQKPYSKTNCERCLRAIVPLERRYPHCDTGTPPLAGLI